MGLYPIDCPTCKKPFLWFSGRTDKRCAECRAVDEAVQLLHEKGVTPEMYQEMFEHYVKYLERQGES